VAFQVESHRPLDFGFWKIKELEKTDAAASTFSNASIIPLRPGSFVHSFPVEMILRYSQQRPEP